MCFEVRFFPSHAILGQPSRLENCYSLPSPPVIQASILELLKNVISGSTIPEMSSLQYVLLSLIPQYTHAHTHAECWYINLESKPPCLTHTHTHSSVLGWS